MLKLLQLQPEKEIIVEFIKNEDYKYVRVLGEAQCRFLATQFCRILEQRMTMRLSQPKHSEGDMRCVRQVRST